MIGDGEVDEVPAVMPEDDEDEEQERECGDEEELDGGYFAEVGRPRRPATSGRPRRRRAHALRDGQFGDVVAEEGEFRADAPAAPGSRLGADCP